MTVPNPAPLAAAIDIGSNSIKMTVGRMSEGSGFEQIGWDSEVVRLGQGIDQAGRLSEERIDAAVATIARFVSKARVNGAQEIVAVATEATRAAANGPQFLERVKEETGVDVRVINGIEEAALTFRGLSTTNDVSGNVVVADIGGGSTELILADSGSVISSTSIPLGSGRLTDQQIHHDPPAAEELANCEQEADTAIRSALTSLPLPQEDAVRLIIVGGTGEFMARLIPNEGAIDESVVRGVIGKLAKLTTAELAKAIEAPEARARVLPAGVAIIAAIAKRVNAQRMEIARSGIRAGLLDEVFDRIRAAGEIGSPATTGAGEPISPPVPPDVDEAIADELNSGGPVSTVSQVSFEEAMRKLIGERWVAVWKTIPAAVEGSDIEGVHDVRVASRRLRAAMDVAATVFPQRWFRVLHRAAKDITSELGAVRDRDVLLEALRADRDAAPLAERPGIDRLIARIDQERIVARAEMERYLAELLRGPIGAEIERRFEVRLPSAGRGAAKGG